MVYANFNNSVCQQNCSDQENEIHVSPKASIVDHTQPMCLCVPVSVCVVIECMMFINFNVSIQSEIKRSLFDLFLN